MNTQVEFLLLDRNNQKIKIAITALAQLYAEYERILVVADDRHDLEQIDEFLWHNSSEQFIPYAVDSESYNNSAAVLLTDNQPVNKHYAALLNMSIQIPKKPEQFSAIIELVKSDDKSLEYAREHFKMYRQLGFSISHQQMN